MTVDNTTGTNITTVATNPDLNQSNLSNDDFLKLLLAEMKYQDPTEPMDNSKMMEQTVQMSTIEANEANVKALNDMNSSFNQSTMFNSISFIDKYVNVGDNSIQLENSRANFEIYIPEDIKEGEISILNQFDEQVALLDISGTTNGTKSFIWDGKDSDFNKLADGQYKVVVNAINNLDEELIINRGDYRIDSIDYSSGETILKSGNKNIAISDIRKTW